MALYELRTYTLHVGRMAEAVKLYQRSAFRRSRRAGKIRSLSDISKATPVRSINLYISGNSMMTPTVARIGPLCMQTGILSKVSPRSSDPY